MSFMHYNPFQYMHTCVCMYVCVCVCGAMIAQTCMTITTRIPPEDIVHVSSLENAQS